MDKKYFRRVHDVLIVFKILQPRTARSAIFKFTLLRRLIGRNPLFVKVKFDWNLTESDAYAMISGVNPRRRVFSVVTRGTMNCRR